MTGVNNGRDAKVFHNVCREEGDAAGGDGTSATVREVTFTACANSSGTCVAEQVLTVLRTPRSSAFYQLLLASLAAHTRLQFQYRCLRQLHCLLWCHWRYVWFCVWRCGRRRLFWCVLLLLLLFHCCCWLWRLSLPKLETWNNNGRELQRYIKAL